MGQHTNVSGQGNVTVQIVGDDNAVTVAGAAALRLTRYQGRRRLKGLREDDKEIRLLSPYTQSIPLLGRKSEQEALRTWLNNDQPISIRVLTARAGSGKTRLALDLCDEIADGEWQAGFVNGNHLAGFCSGAGAASWVWEQPTLVVVDYAATHATTLHSWFGQLVDYAEDSEHPLRLLLLERHAETGQGWWQTAFGGGDWQDQEIQSRLDPAEPIAVAALEEREVRRKIFAATLEASGSDKTPPAPGEDPHFDEQLARLSWGGEPLFLMMAGLLAAKVGVKQVLALSRSISLSTSRSASSGESIGWRKEMRRRPPCWSTWPLTSRSAGGSTEPT